MGQPAIPKPAVKRPTRAEWAEKLLRHATVLKPAGPGPFPVTIQFHGCGGLGGLHRPYAEAAVRAGFAAVIVDSFRPRGMSRLDGSLLVCTGLSLHGAERAADVYAMYDWAQRQPWIDSRRIVLSGWSHGGWSVMDALALKERAARFAKLSDLPPDPLRGVAGIFLVYPYAAWPSMTYGRGWGSNRPKVFAVLCGKDQVVGTRFPQRAIDRLQRDGLAVQRLELPDATHAFDDATPNDPRSRHRPDLYKQAQDWYAAALKSI